MDEKKTHIVKHGVIMDEQPKKKRSPRGFGTVYYVESRKRYAGQITLEIDGIKKRKTVYGKTKTEAKNRLRELQIQAMAGNLHLKHSPFSTTVYELAEKLIERQFALNEIRDSSYHRKTETLKMLGELSNTPLRDVTEDMIVSFFKTKIDYSQSTINKMYQLLGTVFKKAIKERIINENPLNDIPCPKSKQKQIPVRALTLSEQEKLLHVLLTEDIKYSEIMLLSLYTGMRIGECCALTVEDINLDEKMIIISKTVARGESGKHTIHDTKTQAGTRTIWISEKMSQLLSCIINARKSGYLFLSDSRNLVTTQQVNYYYSLALKSNDIVDNTIFGKVTLHSLRHTFATRCIESGMPPVVLQTLLGHTDIKITMNTYCSVSEQYSKEQLSAVTGYLNTHNILF